MSRRIQSRQVDAFRAIMVTGSVSSAASYMHVTQPAVSRLLRDLEYELGFPLFDRAGGRLVPRKAANMLFREVERVYVGLDHILRVAQDIRALSEGVLRIGTVSSLNGVCVNEVLPRLTEQFPALTVVFDTESTERVIDLVTLRQYDIGLICGEHAHEGVVDWQIIAASAVLALPLQHRLAGRGTIALSELQDERIILPGRTSPMRLALEREITGLGIRLRSPVEASLANCCHLAARGIGIAIVDPLVASDVQGQICVRPLEPRIESSYRVIGAKAAPAYSTLEVFLSLLTAAIAARIQPDTGPVNAPAPASGRRRQP
ncbi:MAG: LysR family transcriptional regulator [Rhodoferax sp.]|nr:LysR family transcriptional regulator [Rhodoferax sp.]MCB2006377.1 LysR family transcriptional regulator [Rhodoferax sp.]MCB2027576.1 LysR family transcriptional regulator [Rhodoferax sp.]MCB2039571.1 LysR family transcriptional regulator [Rhodoferax sp.]MCP5263383.1 LysR family transcriptional regulator [Rhodoferax sp.]